MPLNFLQQILSPSPAQQMTQPRQAQTTTGGQSQSVFQQLLSPEVAFPVAAALMGQQGNGANFANAFGQLGPALKDNKTFKYLQQHDPELADAMRNGLLDAKDAYGLMLKKREAQAPNYRYDTIDGSLVRTDTHGGASNVVYRGEGARPMNPQERQYWGIGADDNRPYVMDGGKPRALGGQNISVNMSGEKAYDSAVGGGYGKRFLGLQDEAQGAQKALNTLQVMEGAMSDPGFYSGVGSGSVMQLKRAAQALGMNADGVDSIETFNAMSKQSALDSMGGSLGTGFSNADRDFVIDQVPNLANTPEGNQALVGIQRSIAQRKIDIANLARDYAANNGGRIDSGFDGYLAKWAEQNPLFPKNGGGNGRGAGLPNGPQRQRARNPQTGETVEWDGSQWVPAR